MEGRFYKTNVSLLNISGCWGIDCNNENPHMTFEVMESHFGKPNGNHKLSNESTWKYILEYQNIYITVYDYNNFWSIGFLEIHNIIPDYRLINTLIQMTKRFIVQELKRAFKKQLLTQ